MVEEDREGRSASMMPLRMAVLLQDLEFGGTQRYAVNLLRLLNRDLFTPELWVCRRGYDLLPVARDAGVRTVYLSNSSWVGPRALLHLAWKLYHERPDILYTLTVVPNIWGRIIGSVLGVPVVITGYRSLWPKQHDRWLWRLSRRIICNARASQRVLIERLKVDPTRVSYIPNGVDMSLIPEGFSRASRPTVLSVGRLVDEKDPLTLLESFRLTARAIPEASFVLVGDGYLKDDVQKFIQRHDLVSRVKLLPGTDRVYEHLSEAWVFALASRSESSPNVVIEAMGAGLPVVGTAVGGIPELIEHDKTGMLVEPGDSSRLSQALIRLLTHDNERKAMGIAARDAAVKNFSLETMVLETEKTLMEAASEASRNGQAEG